MEQIKRGGKRNGAGRKPAVNPKRTITLYVDIKSIARFGDADTLKNKLYEFISGYNLPLSEALIRPEHEIKPIEKLKEVPAPIPPENLFEPATGLKASQFDEFHDEIIGTTTIPQLTAVMKKLKSAVLTPKQRQELENIAKEHSATNMYND